LRAVCTRIAYPGSHCRKHTPEPDRNGGPPLQDTWPWLSADTPATQDQGEGEGLAVRGEGVDDWVGDTSRVGDGEGEAGRVGDELRVLEGEGPRRLEGAGRSGVGDVEGEVGVVEGEGEGV
jgi:hypothetical protein